MKIYFPLILLMFFCACEKEQDYFILTQTTQGNGNAKCYPEMDIYEEGNNITLIATPENGFYFLGWEGDIVSDENPYTITKINQNYTYQAVFEENPTIEISDNDYAEFDIFPNILPQGYDVGTNVTITANHVGNWKFVGWIGDTTSTENPLVIENIRKSYSIEAKFEIDDNPIYLAENGVTIKAKEWASAGDFGIVNGEVYTVVDQSILNQMNDDSDYSHIVTSKLTSMYRLFYSNYTFNQDISSWDVSNVTTMNHMFYEATVFNQDLSNWDVSNVENMSGMFRSAKSITSDLSTWDVSKVNNMKLMFEFAAKFSSDLSLWNVGNVENMEYMFRDAWVFNSDLSQWNVSSVVDMGHMFCGAKIYNADLSNWDVDQVVSFDSFDIYVDAWTLPKPNFTTE